MSIGDFTKRKLWSERSWKGKAAVVGLCAAFTAAVFHKPLWHYGVGVSTDVCEVSDKTVKDYRVRPVLGGLLEVYEPLRTEESDAGGHISSLYLIHTKNVPGHEGDECNTKHVSDTMWYFNSRSSDLYGSLEKGKVYELKSVGLDRGFLTGLLGWTPNIVRATEMKGPQ